MLQCAKKNGLEPSLIAASSRSIWREFTTEKAKPQEAETKHSPQRRNGDMPIGYSG
jgi:hypothetical protein